MQRIYAIMPDKIGIINPSIYGHFTEHIGGVIYDGIWVGEDSHIPNIAGIRRDLVELLRRIKPPVIRWPGGCFSETYNWRDGIGPREERPKTVNWWYTWDGKIESNEFGTHEFVRFCRLVSAEPYFAVNIASIPALEIRNWIEYCNFPKGSTSLAELRAKNGDPEPFEIKYWGIGNENWGGGGNFTPEDYCTEFRRVGTIVKSLSKNLHLIACGPNGNDTDWTRRFFEKWKDSTIHHFTPLYGYSVHYYCGTAGSALEFDQSQWYELLHKAAYIEDIITQQRGIIDAYDPERRIGLVVDEWGCWHPEGSGPSKGRNLFEQQSTVRDALVAAITLNIFNNHCDKVVMANVAQLVNNLHSLFLAAGEKLVVTPNYFVFDMYKGHQGGQAVRTLVEAEEIPFQFDDVEKRLFGLSCSASLKDRTLTLTIVNPHFTDAIEMELILWGAGEGKIIRQVVLHAADPHAHNSFDVPDEVRLVEDHPEIAGRRLNLTLPSASIVLLEVELS